MSADFSLYGWIYDGLGNSPEQKYLGVKDGFITYIGADSIEAKKYINLPDHAISPGFIDVHTHSDISLFLDGRGESKIFQGVTTEVTGNCSFGAFPINPEFKELHADLLVGIGDDRIDPNWTDLNEYRQVMQSQGIALNIAPLVGHGALRIAAMGLKEDHANKDEQEKMNQLLSKMLVQGAFGMSTGLTYVPSRYASFDELVELCKVLESHKRIYTSHARDYDILGEDQFTGPLKEAFELSRKSGVRIQYSHAAINDPQLWGQAGRWVEYFEAEQSSGLDARFDVYPYNASSSALTQYLPAWVQEGGVEAMSARLADPIVMSRAESDVAKGWSANLIPWFWDRVVLARTDGLLGLPAGKSIAEAAKSLSITPELLTLELCRLGGNGVMVVLFYRSEEDMRTFARSSRSMICSDGSAFPFDQRGKIPHPRSFGASVRALSRLVRELGDMPLETAIYKMTGMASQHFRIHDRGTLEVGKAADIVVFDPATVCDLATFVAPNQGPEGIEFVIVNGEIAIERKVQTQARSGKVLNANSTQ